MPHVLVLVALSGAGGTLASCASDLESSAVEISDAATDDAPVHAPEDGGDADARSYRDVATSDAGRRPVACEGAPCAKSLVTTLGLSTAGGFCVLLADGTVACWGQNNYGQLGRGAAAGSASSATPQRVTGLSEIVFVDHTCAIDKNGATWCWGSGAFLRSTDEAQTKEVVPVQLPIPPATLVGMRANWDQAATCAVVEAGVLCWGMNRDGQIAVPAPGASPTDGHPASLIPVPPGAAPRALSVGNASFLLREDGTALSWGANPPLGRISSLFPDPYPLPIDLAGVSNIDAVNDNACAVARGIAYCWGSPLDEQTELPLGRALPQPIATPEPVVQIATTFAGGNSLVPQRGCAVGVSGDVYCWGNNDSGQAGDGTKEWAKTPVKVAGLPGPAVEVKTVARTTCALLTSGKAYCWGGNMDGQLGNGRPKVPSSVPVEVQLP